MTRITEKRDVQDQLINYLSGIGWTFIPQNELPAWRNHDEHEPFLVETLRAQLAEFNGWPAGDARIADVERRLRLLPANLEGNEQFLFALRNRGRPTTTPSSASTTSRSSTTRTWPTTPSTSAKRSGSRTGTGDVWTWCSTSTVYPCCSSRTSRPSCRSRAWKAFEQVQETYTSHIPEFIKYPIPFAICATRLEYGATWNPKLTAFYRWKVDGRDFGLEELGKSFFARQQVLRLLRDYAIFYRMDDALQKFILRPHQMRAVEKIEARVVAGQAEHRRAQHRSGMAHPGLRQDADHDCGRGQAATPAGTGQPHAAHRGRPHRA